MVKTEKDLQNYTKKEARKHGVGYYKLTCVGQTGFPDVLLTWHGWCIFIELKSPAGTGRVPPRQTHVLAQLSYQDIETYVISQPEQIDALIAGLIHREPRPMHHAFI